MTFRLAWEAENDPHAFAQYCQTAFSLEKIQAEMAQADAEFYFARAGETVAAYLKLNIGRQPVEDWDGSAAMQIERVYVAPDFQGAGLGTQLLQFADERARATRARWIWLSVWQKSPRTIAFYSRHGYTIFGMELFELGDDPQPDWLMKKQID